MSLAFPRRRFVQAAAALAIAPARTPAAAVAGEPRGPAPGRTARRRSHKHALYRARVLPDFRPAGVADQPASFAGAPMLLARRLSLKQATRRAHAFNRAQLATGFPVREWAFVVALCREVSHDC